MQITVPVIIDVDKNIIRTSDGFTIDLNKKHDLHLLWQDKLSKVHTDIGVRNISILQCNNGTTKLVNARVYQDLDYNASVSLHDITDDTYIFFRHENMFKFGYSLGQELWKSDSELPWITPPTV